MTLQSEDFPRPENGSFSGNNKISVHKYMKKYIITDFFF